MRQWVPFVTQEACLPLLVNFYSCISTDLAVFKALTHSLDGQFSQNHHLPGASKETEKVVQLVKCMPCKNAGLGSSPRTLILKARSGNLCEHVIPEETSEFLGLTYQSA